MQEERDGLKKVQQNPQARVCNSQELVWIEIPVKMEAGVFICGVCNVKQML